MQSQIVTVEIKEAGEHMDALTDAVMRGGEVVMTHCGEPVAGVHLRRKSPDVPEALLRATVVDVLDETLKHLRWRLDLPAWILN